RLRRCIWCDLDLEPLDLTVGQRQQWRVCGQRLLQLRARETHHADELTRTDVIVLVKNLDLEPRPWDAFDGHDQREIECLVERIQRDWCSILRIPCDELYEQVRSADIAMPWL